MSKYSNFLIHESFLTQLTEIIDTSETIVIVAHTNADPDALASALGLRALFAQILPSKKIKVLLPKLNTVARNIWKRFQFDSPLWEISTDWPPHIDLLIILDATDYELINSPYPISPEGRIEEIQHVYAIDHHSVSENESKYCSATHILPDYSSATEIVIEFYRYLQLEPDFNISKFLLAGIITDTGHFRYANSRTLDNAKILLDKGLLIAEINNALYNRMGRSEKIARIKAAMRINQLYYIKQIVVTISHVSSFEASACKALLDLGADVSFVIAFERKQMRFRMSSRTREDVIKKYQFHLGEFMQRFGKLYGGAGGGHDGAAGCYGNLQSLETLNSNDSPESKPPKLKKELFDEAYFAQMEPKILKLLREMVK
ncbi:MAG: DHH family phosphoesterase [Promethearchaeota archaeon]